MLRANRFVGLANICKTATRSYIRPHYYQNGEPLSKALQKQQNPFRQLSRKLNNVEPNKVLWTLIGTNVSIYFAWQYSINAYTQFGDTHWLKFMADNFIVSSDAIDKGRYQTLLTCVFSHKSLEHLGINMFMLYTMGQGVIEAIGASRFLLLYTGAGVAASAVAVGYKRYIKPMLEEKKYGYRGRVDDRGSLGASGSVMAVTTFFACAFPRTKFLLFFVIPMPAIATVGLLAGYDFYKAYTLNTDLVDSAAHLGGVAYGAAYWYLRVRPLLKAGRWRV